MHLMQPKQLMHRIHHRRRASSVTLGRHLLLPLLPQLLLPLLRRLLLPLSRRLRLLLLPPLLLLSLLLLHAAAARADDETPVSTKPAECPAVPTSLAPVVVTGVRAAGIEPGDPAPAIAKVKLRDTIILTVKGLPVLLAHERCAASRKRLVLYLDGRPLPNIVPYPPSGPESNTLSFILNRNEDSREIWTYLLGKPSFKPRKVTVSVGMVDEYPVPAPDVTIALDIIPLGWLSVWSVLFVLMSWAFLAMAKHSDVLRASGPQPPAGRKPFSLSKTQAAVWFFLIIASYLFIGLITGDYGGTITDTVLGLMGISAGTAVGASLLQPTPAAKVAAAEAEAAQAATPPAPPPAPEDALAQALATPAPSPARPSAPNVTTGSWWMDILSDEEGVNFHRFQMAAWTAVLGIIFIQQVYGSLAMPDFNSTLLALLGISSGTYLGLKATSELR